MTELADTAKDARITAHCRALDMWECKLVELSALTDTTSIASAATCRRQIEWISAAIAKASPTGEGM